MIFFSFPPISNTFYLSILPQKKSPNPLSAHATIISYYLNLLRISVV